MRVRDILGGRSRKRKKVQPKKRKSVKVALKIKGNVKQVQSAVQKLAGNSRNQNGVDYGIR